jgi:hypothetical protein
MPWWNSGTFFDKVLVKFQRGTLDQHYKTVFDSASGRIVLTDFLQEAGFFATPEGLSADEIVFAAGKRHMATHLMARLNFVPAETQQIAHLTSVERDDA